jgi:DNA mismatch endonuclease, patch repair protein
MQGNRGRDTKPEMEVRRRLHRLGLRYRVCMRPLRTDRRTADIVFRRLQVAVFVDGCFWHRCPEHGTNPASNVEFWQAKLARNVARDRDFDECLAKEGWTVLRFWEHMDPDTVVETVFGVVRQRMELHLRSGGEQRH